MNPSLRAQRGFTILEMLMAMAIFLIICAAMFELLNLSQKKYSSETQLTAVYQDARLAMDQIVRDVNVAGYPPATMFTPIPISYPSRYAVGPVAWSPGYASTPQASCQIGTIGSGTCASPGDFDLIVETRLSTDTQVSWIWYHLTGTTLYRTVVPKTSGDPLSIAQSAGDKVPFLSNVMNNPGWTMLAQITADHPAMFPGNQPLPIFQYTCSTSGGASPTMPCPLAGTTGTPQNVRDVDVTLVVMTPQRDLQTRNLKLVELNGRGHRVNPTNY